MLIEKEKPDMLCFIFIIAGWLCSFRDQSYCFCTHRFTGK